jgi:ankyrin repeat protein
MSKSLPENPNSDHLRKQAKKLLSAYRDNDPDSISRLAENLPGYRKGVSLNLHDAQSALAREYGFPSWKHLLEQVEQLNAAKGITQEIADEFVRATVRGRFERAKRLLELYPALPRFSQVTGLVFGDVGDLPIEGQLAPEGWQAIEYVSYSNLCHLDADRWQALETAAKGLLDSGADPNAAHSEGEPGSPPLSALYGASGETGHIGIVKLLLEAGANPNDGESIYHSAQFNRREILELLLRHGGDISRKDEHWTNTPIYFLCGHRQTDHNYQSAVLGVEWLLENGADPDVRCYNQGEVALHAASRSQAAEMVALLLKHGADPNIRRADGRMPFDLAAVSGNQPLIEAFAAKGAVHTLSESDQFFADCAEGKVVAAGRFLERHPGFLDESEEAKELFIRFGEHGNETGLRTFLDLGMPAAARNAKSETALHFACFCGHKECVDLLLSRGAPLDIEEKTYNGNPLGWANQAMLWHRNPMDVQTQIIQSLMRAGASRDQLAKFFDVWEDAPEDMNWRDW